jgi:hypothetical protein
VPATVTPAGVVRWAHGPHVFALSSPDPRIIARAAVVFHPWPTGETSAAPLGTWTVTPSRDGAHWVVESAGDGLEPAARDTIGGTVTVVEYRAVSVLIRTDVVSLHAALVSRDGRGVLIVGAPESGKSTLATALWRRGYTFFGDDTVVIDAARVRASSVPRRVALRRSSRSLLGGDWWARALAGEGSDPTAEGLVFHPREFDAGRPPADVKVSICLFLNRVAGEAGVPRRMSEAAATLALLPYSNLALRLDAGAVIARLAPFADGVRSYDLLRADLPAMCGVVDRLLDEDVAS